MMDMTEVDTIAIPGKPPKFRDPPQEPDPLAKKWGKQIAQAKKYWEKFHKRVKHNRKLAAGFDWSKDPDSENFYTLRANLIYGAISAYVPTIYARNPEISVVPKHAGRELKLLCKTIGAVVNQALDEANLKVRAKATIMSALICSFGVLKVMYQRDIKEDPIIKAKIEDAQDNIIRIESLIMQLTDDQQRADQERIRAELEQTLSALQEQVEIAVGEGMVIDRVLTENLLIDPTVAEFWDYPQADWMAQIVPMKKPYAEGLYGYRLDKAKKYNVNDARETGRIYSGGSGSDSEDVQIFVLEIWDKQSQRVYTMAEGCDFWLREPYSPQTGERWYPFFLLPYNTVDGQFVAPSVVDLTEQLQKEHNDARDKYNHHRELVKPGYVAASDINHKTLKNFTDSVLGEVTLIDTEGKPINQVIAPKQHPPFDMAAYDVSGVRYDFETVTGMQDATRSSIVKPKTATEASIMQQSLSGRVSSFRDQVEDYLQEIAQYVAQLLLQEYNESRVEKIMGPHKTGPLPGVTDPMTGEPIIGIIEHSYDWPALSKDEIFNMVQLQIRAGTTGEPDKIEQQETWGKILPVIQQMVGQIMQLQVQGMDTGPTIALLRETVSRFDDRLDVDELIPKPPQPQMPGMPIGAGQPPPDNPISALVASQNQQQPGAV